MALISQANVVAGLEMLKKRLLYLRVRCKYIIKHEPPGARKETLLDELEEEIEGLSDQVTLLTSLREG